MGKQYICAECSRTFLWTPRGRSGRPPVTCSDDCRTSRRLRLDRERHEREALSAGHVRVRSSKYRSYVCAVDGCDRQGYSRGLCSLHYNRRRTTGDTGPAGLVRRHGIKRVVDKRSGYAYVYDPRKKNGRTTEHRIVMEQMLGRELLPAENVHHRNGIRDDNRPENLELWVKAQPCGQRVEDLVAFVVRHYPTDVIEALRSAASEVA